MSREVSESGVHDTPVTQTENLSSEPFVQEFLHLVDEGWEPDLEEFIKRVPDAVREEVFERLDENLEQRTVKTWDEKEGLVEGHVLRQPLCEETSESIMAAAMDDSVEPPSTDHVAEAELPLPVIIPLAEPMEVMEQRFAPPAAEPEVELPPEPEPEPEPAPELESESEPSATNENWSSASEPTSLAYVAGMDLRRDLGRGSLGESFLGVNATGGLKSVTVASADLPANVLQRLSRVAAKVRTLNIDELVAIEEAKHEPAGVVLIAPFIEGEPIDRAVDELDLADAVRYLQLVVEALASAHAAGLTHLNLKPSNVLVTPDGEVRLLDFGVGSAVTSVPKRLAQLAGPGHYLSPEHASRGRLGKASDIFSFGSLMYRVLTRKLPFPGGAPDLIQTRIDAAEPVAPRLHDERIPQALQDICLACLARKPADRPSAGTLIAELDRFLVGSPVRLRPTLYRGMLRRQTREVLAEVQGWQKQGLAKPSETDRLEALCRRILAREEQWTSDPAKAPRTRAVVVVGTLLFALSAVLLVRFGYAHVSMFAAFFPVIGVGALFGAGMRAARRGEASFADPLIAGGLVALGPALLTVLQRTAFLDGAGPLAGLAWLQIAAAALVVGVAAAVLLHRRRNTVYAWIACAAAVCVWGAGVGTIGLLGYGALTLAPIALLLVVAQQFESHDRFEWMRPFLLTGLAALIAIPLYAASSGAITALPGIEVSVVGLLFWGSAWALSRKSSLALNEAARWLGAIAPGVLLAGLFWHQAGAAGQLGWWGLLAIAMVLTVHGALLQRANTLAWGIASLLCILLVFATRGVVTPWTLAIAVGGLGLAASIVIAVASERNRSYEDR